MDRKKIDILAEKRKFLRLTSVMPVHYQIVGEKEGALTEIAQAFTRDVSYGGLCLEVSNLKDELVQKLMRGQAKFSIEIEVPFLKKPVAALGSVVWSEKIKESYPNKYLFGVIYEHISEEKRRKIIKYAHLAIWKPRLAGIVFFVIIILAVFAGHRVFQEQKAGEFARQKIIALQKEKNVLETRLLEINQTKRETEQRLQSLQNERLGLEEKIDRLSRAEVSQDQLRELESQLAGSQEAISSLDEKLGAISREKKQLEEEVAKLKGRMPAVAVGLLLSGNRYMEGVLAEENTEFIKIKLVAGTVTFDRNEILTIKRLSRVQALRIEHEIEESELKKKKSEEARDEFVKNQKAKGLVFYEGRWIEKERYGAIKTREVETGELISRIIGEKRVKVTLGKKNVYVNGKPIFIKGIAYNISYPGYAQGIVGFGDIPFNIFEKDFKMMKEAGVNVIKTYEPFPDELLDLAEKYGFFVIETVVCPSAYTDYGRQDQLQTLKETAVRNVLRHKDKPCILMWSVWNDIPFEWSSAGNIVERYGQKEVNDFLKQIYDAVKETDKEHPVTAANVLDAEGCDVGFDFLDVIGINLYIGGHGYTWEGKEKAEEDVRELFETASLYNKPIFISETGYSTFIEKDTQDNALKIQFEALGRKGAGMVVFEWVDEWWKAGNAGVQDRHVEEHWGIVSADREPKDGYEAVKKYYTETPTFLE